MNDKNRRLVGGLGAAFVIVGSGMASMSGLDVSEYLGIGSTLAGVLTLLIGVFKR